MDRGGRNRTPAELEPSIEEFIRARLVVPGDDRRHRAQSRAVVAEPEVWEFEDDVVGELVLVDDPGEAWRRLLGRHPRDHLVEHMLV